MKIDKNTNMPKHIPQRCTGKIDIRCLPEVKQKIKLEADKRKTSMTKVILDLMETAWRIQAFKPDHKYPERWDGDQLVWEFV
jgi:hypothetical protein